MTAHDRAWDAAWDLAMHHPYRLTPAQHILCITTMLRHPERAGLEVIALAAQILGARQ